MKTKRLVISANYQMKLLIHFWPNLSFRYIQMIQMISKILKTTIIWMVEKILKRMYLASILVYDKFSMC